MRQGYVPPRRDQRGFTLVEVMVAAAVLMIGVLGTLVMIDGANKVQRDNNARTSAAGLARDILEQARAIEYESIAVTGTTTTGLVQELRKKASLTGSINAAGEWVINRRGVDFTVSTSACTFDDPSDSLGSPGPANPCPAGAGATAGTDSNPDDFRRVIVTIRWKENNKTQQLVHTTQIVNPGGGLGPRITSFPNPNGGLQIGDHKDPGNGPTSVLINAESTYASVVRWSVDDGRSSGDATMTEPGGKKWNWTWQIGTAGVGTPGVDWVLDGSYAVNAQAFDSRGVPGELRVANVILNRRQALAPKLVGGGRSGGGSGSANLVEMDWLPSPERDVIGYRVYRLKADNVTREARICPPASVTTGDQVVKDITCTDTNPPGESLQPTVKYEIVAIDRPILGDLSSGTWEGDVTTLSVGPLSTNRLDRPTNLTASTVNGRPRLTWTAPSLAAGEQILFYRIYRDGVRLTRTVSDATTFSDNAPTANTHTYMVSAVDGNYREGKLSDPKVWP